MRVFVTGTRGIPSIPGGVETHCEQIYPRLAKNCAILLSRRVPYVDGKLQSWEGVNLVDIYTPKSKSLEAIIHTLFSILYARKWQADIVHIHSIGPALLTPFARLLGMKVVFTNHGPDYDRQKWGGMASFTLRLGEYLGGKFANEVIVISRPIRSIVQQRCNRESVLIPNGVELPNVTANNSYIKTLGLEVGGYILAVARLVPEKGLHDLIEAYLEAAPDCKLVIAGDSDHEDAYSRSIKELAKAHKKIVLAGYVVGDQLAELYSHANLFVLPSYHEGLPIVLLEAMSYGLPVIVSSIPANLDVELQDECYFECGDVTSLASKIAEMNKAGGRLERKASNVEFVRKKYNWDNIAKKTLEVYEGVINEK